MDHQAIEQVVLRELQRQGIEFARVKMRTNYPGSEYHLIIEPMTQEQIQPKYVEKMRVANQIKPRLLLDNQD